MGVAEGVSVDHNPATIVHWKCSEGDPSSKTSLRQLCAMIDAEEVDETALVAFDGQAWMPAGSVPACAAAFEDRVIRRCPRRTAETELDLAPMIDVTFLLLLFFMITATYDRQKTLDTPTPPAEGAVARPTLQELQKANILVKVDAEGDLRVDDAPVSWADLRSHLRSKIQELKTTSLVIVAADDADWQHVVRLQDESSLAGIERIRFGKRVSPANR